MLRALGILEWSLDHQNRLGHSLGLYLWMLLTEEDAEEQLSELTDVVYNFDNNVTDYLYTRHRHLADPGPSCMAITNLLTTNLLVRTMVLVEVAF